MGGTNKTGNDFSLQNGSITSTHSKLLLPPVMLSLPEQGPRVWEYGISHTKHWYEKA